MKPLFIFGLSVLFSSFCSCVSNDEANEPKNDHVDKVQITIEPMEEESSSSRMVPALSGTKLSYPWELNDSIGIFPSKGGQVEFVISEKFAGETFAIFDGGGWGLKNTYTYSAYYPFNFYNRDSKKIPFTYNGQVQDGNNSRSHLRDYVVTTAAPTTVENNELYFNLIHVGSVLNLKLTMPEPNTYSTVTVYTEGKVIPVKKTVNLQDAELTQTVTEYSDGITIKLKNIKTTTENEMIQIWMAFPSMSEATYPLKVVVYDEQNFPYIADITKLDGTQAYASFTKHKWQERKASPVLTEGFNFGLKKWDQGSKTQGRLQ